jgi:electron-transferring-flavoprotein dehydrogenase
MKSGMVAAESVFQALSSERSRDEVTSFAEAFRASWVYDELKKARNVRPSFKWGLVGGTLYTGIDQVLLRGKAPWTLKHPHADNDTLKPASECAKIEYPKPDGEVSFDRLSSVFLSNTVHEENQPVHLTLKDDSVPIDVNLAKYEAPEQRYCPAGVYEIVRDDNDQPRLQINFANCVHCKTCDIKDPTQNIVWVTPQGGDGPNYPNM